MAVTVLEGIPLYLLAVMCSLAGLGIVYAVTILAFNLYLRKDKIIKMTSPNLNVVILLGCVLVYATAAPLGLDSGRVGCRTRGMLLQSVTFLLACGFTMVYGTTLAKAFRVYLVFRNLSFNGKITRDEHLVIGILIMLLLDLCLLLPWAFVDPISCGQSNVTITKAEGVPTFGLTELCNSRLLPLWTVLLYAYKASILTLTCYFTWKTRRVTLPALQDAGLVYTCVYSVAAFAVLGLPLILTESFGPQLKYAVGTLTIITVTTATITLLFIPKLYLYKKQCKLTDTDTKLMFSESMQNTQAAERGRGCLSCCHGNDGGDIYGQQMLTSEIEHLNRAIKQKDATIRELTDRLYFETEKNKGYFKSPKYQQYLAKSQRDLQRSQRELDGQTDAAPSREDRRNDSDRQLAQRYRYSPGMERAFKSPKLQRRILPVTEMQNGGDFSQKINTQTLERPTSLDMEQEVSYSQKFPSKAYDDNRITRITDSPNTDSAIENVSPSSDSSERGSVSLESSALRTARDLTAAQSSDPKPHFVNPTYSALPWYSEELDLSYDEDMATSTPRKPQLECQI